MGWINLKLFSINFGFQLHIVTNSHILAINIFIVVLSRYNYLGEILSRYNGAENKQSLIIFFNSNLLRLKYIPYDLNPTINNLLIAAYFQGISYWSSPFSSCWLIGLVLICIKVSRSSIILCFLYNKLPNFLSLIILFFSPLEYIGFCVISGLINLQLFWFSS